MRPMARSHSSGSAKMPSVSGTSGKPSHRYKRVHGPAQRARLRVGADHRQHHAEAGGGEPAQRRIAGQHRHHGNAEHGDAEQFGRADIENDRAQDRQRDRHQRRAEQAADQRRHVGGAERAAGLAAPRHRIAVERRRRRRGVAGRAEQDRGDRIGRRGGGAEPEQQRERRRRIEIIGERQQQRRAGDAADARQNAERQAHAHAAEQIQHARRVEDDEQGMRCGMQHVRFH